MPKVSLFKNIASVRYPDNIDLIRYLEDTRDGVWEDITTQCRLIKDKKERKAFKDTMPTATLSGVFSYRDDKNLSEHSSILAMDLDAVENLNEVKKSFMQDRYVFSVFVSTSGNGLRVLFKIDPKKHNEAFKGIRKYIFDNYGQLCDPNSSISKPYLVSFDPYLYLNPEYNDVPVFRNYIKETVIKEIPNFVHTAYDFEDIFKQIIARGVNLCDDYNDYLKIGYSFVHQFGEAGRGFFHTLSQISEKYDYKTVNKQYDYCLKSKGSNPTKIATFYYLAKMAGINIISEKTKTIIRTTKSGKRAGLKKDDIAKSLLKHNISGVEDVIETILNDPNNDSSDDNESILDDLELFLSNNYDLVMNEVTGYLEHRNTHEQISQSDLNGIFVAAKKLIPKLDYQLMMRLLKSPFIEVYNPFFKFFDSDGLAVVLPATPDPEPPDFPSPLIDLLAKTIENDNPSYTLCFLKKWIVSIVSSAHKVHSPLLLCLLGGQNSGKTEWFRRLLPKELQPYYAESKLDKEKDDELLMTENLVILDDEFGGKSKRDNLKLKNITSKQWFSLRRPYGDHNEKIRRLAVLCGTSNQLEILTDPTGNRRILPIEVININKELYNSIDKKQLFMEAFRLYKLGFDWRVTQNDLAFLNKDQAKYETIIAEKELIERYYEPYEECIPSERMSTTDIKVELENLTNQRLSLNEIGSVLKRLGYTLKTTREHAYSMPKKWCIKKIGRAGSGWGSSNVNF